MAVKGLTVFGCINYNTKLSGVFGSLPSIPGIAAARAMEGPSLAASGKRSYIAAHIPNFPDALVRWIVAPASLVRLD